jgi:glycosyltransferase involved in cell wall biosynthesis
MKIAFMGTRGIPANYSGFETFYENLAPRLAGRGHEVTVYNRPHHVGHRELTHYRGVRLVHLPSLPTKHLDTFTHTALSVLHGLTQGYDIVYFCGVGNAPLVWVPRLAGATVLHNVDGKDWTRAKWGRFAAWYLRSTERFAGAAANVIIADNQAIQQRYLQDYGIASEFVPYGANVQRDERTDALAAFGLEPRRYVLWVGRLVPEARVEELIEAFRSLEAPGWKLVVLGDAPFAEEYKALLRSVASPDVVFTGYRFGAAYAQLSCHAYAYVQPSPVSGTSPALLDQMAFGNAVVVRGTPTNREVVQDAGLVYDPEEPVRGLAAELRRLLDEPALAARLRRAAVRRIEEAYSWESVTDRYEALFARLRGDTGQSRAGEALPSGEAARATVNWSESENRCAS